MAGTATQQSDEVTTSIHGVLVCWSETATLGAWCVDNTATLEFFVVFQWVIAGNRRTPGDQQDN
jgi:hypothetical protein